MLVLLEMCAPQPSSSAPDFPMMSIAILSANECSYVQRSMDSSTHPDSSSSPRPSNFSFKKVVPQATPASRSMQASIREGSDTHSLIRALPEAILSPGEMVSSVGLSESFAIKCLER